LKLAIIADIHANLHALEAVLSDIRDEGVDHIIVNGDLVNRGPNNLAVLERLWTLGATLILGNHDDLMRKWIERDPDLPQSWFDDPFWGATAWSARSLQAAGWIEKLAALPMTYVPDYAEAPSLLISHGSPRHYREGYSDYTPDTVYSEILQDHPADVLIGSHTHRPIEHYWGPHAIFNTGAVGAPFNGNPNAQYLILRLVGESWQPEFRQVAYDRAPALKAFETTGMLEEGGLSAHIFREELKNARSYLTPFWMWTEEQGCEQTWETWRQFQHAFPGRFKAV